MILEGIQMLASVNGILVTVFLCVHIKRKLRYRAKGRRPSDQ